MKKVKDELEQNYRNFGIAILAILAVFVGLATIAHFLDLTTAPNINTEDSAYSSGVQMGRKIGWYFKSGLWLGNLFALFAAMKKRHSLGKGILLSLTGWVYVIYFALTRKTVTPAN